MRSVASVWVAGVRLGVFGASVAVAVAAGGVGCGGSKGSGSSARVGGSGAGNGSCLRMRPNVGATPLGHERASSSVALARLKAKTIAYVADEDDATLHVVDVDASTELATLGLDGRPSQLLVAPDGRIFVALRDKSQVEVLEPFADGTVERRCTVETQAEPIALALTPDDRTLLVTSGWGQALDAFDVPLVAHRYKVELSREPRAVVVSDDGAKAYVSHAVGGAVSVVDLAGDKHPVKRIVLSGNDDPLAAAAPKKQKKSAAVDAKKSPPRTSCQGFALAKSIAPVGRVLAPQVLVDSGNTEERSTGYGTSTGTPTEVSDVAVIDEGTDRPLESSLTVRTDARGAFGGRASQKECVLPRSAAVDPHRESLFVTCLGIDTVVEYDTASPEPHHAEKRRWAVSAGPTGIAIDQGARRAVVWAQFDRELDVISLGGEAVDEQMIASAEPIVRVALSRRAAPPATADIALGRRLFHAAGDPRIANDGRACASCHPDGRDDAITWATPEGPRQTPMLAGRLAGTAPYAWDGTGDDVKTHVTHTFQRLRGSGLQPQEMDSLVAFVTTMSAPPPARLTRPRQAEEVARGAGIFHSGEAGCASCHGKNGSAPDGEKHDVESRAPSDLAATFDTPSLRFIGGTAPYFHDGRYASLRELLVASDGKMGKTSHLSKDDVDALEAYLRSL
jgi:DNA-binding beta-propeller fold protein YncE/mono/diheme cytochrome c family protein